MRETQGGAECTGTAIEPAVNDGSRVEPVAQGGGVDLVNIGEQGVIAVEYVTRKDDLVRVDQGGGHHECVRQGVGEVLSKRKDMLTALCDRVAQLGDRREGQAAIAAMGQHRRGGGASFQAPELATAASQIGSAH